MLTDIVIGAVTNYNYDQIKYWANSLDRSGFEGAKMLFCYDIDDETIKRLNDRNYYIARIGGDGKLIMTERFYHYWMILNMIEKEEQYRYVIATDVGDVVFQQNPSIYLSKVLGKKYKINASSESIRYKDEVWGRNNLQNSFGELVYDYHKENIILNAGVIAGEFKYIKDLFLNIFLTSGGAPKHVDGGGGPDQAAYNIIMNSLSVSQMVNVSTSEDGWAAQLGTTKDPSKIQQYKPYLLDPEPIMVGDMVCTSKTKKPFYIVHQYNRIPGWKEVLESKFND